MTPKPTTDRRERRIIAGASFRLERRGEGDAATQVMIGHAAVFNQWADIGGYFRERVKDGAFADVIKTDDVRALWNHNPDHVLGRSRARPTPTLRLAEDAIGLGCEIDVPDTQTARDLAVLMRRGDVSQMSYAFSLDDSDQLWEKLDGVWHRTITRVSQLWDVSPVTYPAFEGTDIAMRSSADLVAAVEQRAAGAKAVAPTFLERRKRELQLAGLE